jgi:uracil-DNA glycosylase
VTTALQAIHAHQARLKTCRLCPAMIGPVVTGQPVVSPVLLIGQAPGAREGPAGRPFAWTAGKTLFRWFGEIGLPEEPFRSRVYMAAVCRCFPGKNPKGGDRVPDATEVANCARWLEDEIRLLRPQLLIPVGKLAIGRFLPLARLDAVIGRTERVQAAGHEADLIALPHPSGASTWHRTEPGKALLAQALALIGAHPAWQSIIQP